jgi:soluble lytic murein transglycosylase-like protein
MAASVIFALSVNASTTLALAQTAADDRPQPEDRLPAVIAEAARRFGLPEAWIRAVIQAESAFDPQATSRVGAMGLMQVMPATYAELRARYGLGPDAYDTRDNVLAGAAYLRELYDRFGPTGFLAAYNAGPGRYQDHLQTGRPLPLETRVYVARIAGRLGVGQADRAATERPIAPLASAPDPAAASIFVSLSRTADPEGRSARPARSDLFPVPRHLGSGHD